MSSFSVKQILILGVVLVGIILSVIFGFVIFNNKSEEKIIETVSTPIVETEVKEKPTQQPQVIGRSVEGRPIEAYSFGNGEKHILFVGGVHGGYEWNSVLLAYKAIDYFKANPVTIPRNVTVDIIPTLNPDGVYKATNKIGRFLLEDVSVDKKILAEARFNAHNVDLNRNFDCTWAPTSTWQSKTVSAGTAPFSEPETKTLQTFVLQSSPVAVILWHSKSNGIYASQCHDGILPETLTILNTYSQASGYPSFKTFDAYEITGAADDWLSTINIPAITVELETREGIEWEKNLAGINALFRYYGK